MATMKFSSSDGVIFEVNAEIAKSWPLIKTMVEDLCTDEEEEEEAFPLTTISSVVLKKVIEWSTHHKDNPPTFEEDEMISDFFDVFVWSTHPSTSEDWEEKFLKVDQCTLFGLIKAASFFQIKELLHITCQAVANMIKGKTTEEIRKTFNIKNDFTAEEEEELRKSNQLYEEM